MPSRDEHLRLLGLHGCQAGDGVRVAHQALHLLILIEVDKPQLCVFGSSDQKIVVAAHHLVDLGAHRRVVLPDILISNKQFLDFFASFSIEYNDLLLSVADGELV